MQAQIKIISGPHSGQLINLRRLPLLIGRAATCQVRIEGAETVSIGSNQGTYYLEDLSGCGGVALNGIGLHTGLRYALADGDVIRVGQSLTLSFHLRLAIRPGARLYEQAQMALQQGERSAARQILENAVRQDLFHAGAWLLLAELVEDPARKRRYLRAARRGCGDVRTRQSAERELAELERLSREAPRPLSRQAAVATAAEEKPTPAKPGVLIVLQFLLRKSLRVATILVGATLITFLLMHAVPASPWSNYSSSPRMIPGLEIDKTTQLELNRHFGLDLPLWRQFTRYLLGDFDEEGLFVCGAVCGNLGPSIQMRGRSVQHVLFEPPEGKTFWESRFGFSARMVLLGSLIAVGLGIPLGILSVQNPKSAFSHAISVGLAAVISIPNFVLGLLAIIVLASWLDIMNILPDWDYPSHWIIPAMVLSVMPMAGIARVTQASLGQVLTEDYIRTAYAKGLTHTRVMLVHVMRNAFVPIITFLGPTLVEMSTGLLVVENLYAFPGFGRQYFEAILKLDYPMIMGLTLIYATGIVLVNTLIEVLGEILDPRLRSIRQPGAA